jgi:hypothetical protein
MRKLLASVFALAVVAAPVTVALAAEDDEVRSLPTAAEQRAEVARFKAVDQVIERRAERAEKAERAERRAAERRRARRAERRRERRADRRAERGGGASPALEAIAACESGGDPQAVGGGGTYRGKYQFSRETWASVGGSGDPAAAPEAEQDRRAATLYARTGASSWPVCGQG